MLFRSEKGKLLNLFRTKKFVEENFEADKQLIIDKYNELGYRDAMIVKDSIKSYDDRTVDIFMEIEEGQKYYLRNVTWVGNTLYPSEQLNFLLRMKKGDVYNQKLLEERTVQMKTLSATSTTTTVTSSTRSTPWK